MINYKNLIPFTMSTDRLTFDIKKTKLTQLMLFIENDNFEDIYNLLNIKLLYFRNLLIPRYKSGKIRVWNMSKDAMELKKKLGFKLSTIDPERIKKSNLNFIFDTTQVINEISNKFPNLQSSKSMLAYFDFLKRYDVFPNKYSKILMYIVNLDKPFNTQIKTRKVYLLLRLLLLNIKSRVELPFDDLVLCTIQENIPTYKKLVSNKEINFPRIFALIRNLKMYYTDEEVEQETSKIMTTLSEKVPDIVTVNREDMRKYIKDVKPDLPEVTSLSDNILDEPTDEKTEVIKHNILASVYSVTKNKQVVNNVYRNIKHKQEEQLKALYNIKYHNFYNKYSLPDKVSELEVIPNNELFAPFDFKKIADNQIPIKLLNKRKVDFNANLVQDVTKIFKSFEKRDIPLVLKSVTKVDDTTSIKGELYPTKCAYLVIEMEDPETKEIFTNRIKIPEFQENNVFVINGIKKILINQVVPIPIYFNTPYNCRVQTNYATITISQLEKKKQSVFGLYIGGFDLPLPLVMLYYYGIKETFKSLDLKYSACKKDDKDCIQLPGNNSIKVDKPKNKYQEIFITSLKMIPSFDVPDKLNDINNKKYYADWIIQLTKNRNSAFIISEVMNNLVDPISKDILESKGLPVTTKDIILYVIKKLPSGFSQDRMDLNNSYLRTSDIISHILLKQAMTAYNHFKAQKLSSGYSKFELEENNVFAQLQSSGTVQTLEYCNPIEELSYQTRFTQSGFGGLHGDAVTLEARAISPSYFGQVSTTDTPEGGSIGVIQHFAVGVDLANTRGIFGIKPISNNYKSGILSVTESTIPLLDKNEPTRTIMSCAQSKQIVPVHGAEIPAVVTGYEAVIPALSSSNFVVKSPCSGTVTKSELNKIEIKCDKTKNLVSIEIPSYTTLKTGQGYSVYSKYTNNTKEKQKVKTGEILASGIGIKDNVLATGINALCAFMQYKTYTYEDGIVISESLAKSRRLSNDIISELEVIIKPKDRIIFSDIQVGKIYTPGDIMLKYIPESISEVYDIDNIGESELFDGMILKRSPGGYLLDAIIGPNEPLITYPESIRELYEKQENKFPVGSYKYKGEHIQGIYIKLIFKTELSIGLGDKMANRHGAKGIVCYIEKDEYMPRTKWGEKIELIVNPIGIMNRLNLGQLFEQYLGLISRQLSIFVEKNSSNKNKVLRMVLKVYQLLDNTQDKIIAKQFSKYIENISDKDYNKFVKSAKDNKFVPIIVPPFSSPTIPQIKNVFDEFKLDINGEYLFLPEYNTNTKDKVSVGYIYFNKLEHLAYKKFYSRGLSYRYQSKTGQPTSGKANEGGQKVGEFDSWSLMGWGVENTLKEFFGPLSDDKLSKQKMLENIIKSGDTKLIYNNMTPTKDLVSNIMKIVGLQVETNQGGN